jgi:hypothetical protein
LAHDASVFASSPVRVIHVILPSVATSNIVFRVSRLIPIVDILLYCDASMLSSALPHERVAFLISPTLGPKSWDALEGFGEGRGTLRGT